MTISRLQRNTLIATIWTILYFWWFRWVIYRNWAFEIFYAKHWQYLWNEWWYRGWVIQSSDWWFVLFVLLCIPVWIWTTCFWINRHYTKYFEKAFWDSIYKRKVKAIHSHDSRIRVKKKKSYKEIRPQPLAGTPQKVAPVQQTTSRKSERSEDVFDSKEAFSDKQNDLFAPFNLQENEPMPSFELPEITPLKEDYIDIMQSAGAAVITNPKIGDQKIDYLAIAKNDIYYILLDAEKGNWLADEERFNDEDPLWYSEEPICVSPLIKKFEQVVEDKLSSLDINMKGHIVLVKTDGNIINVEDMQDTWKEMGVLVARSNLGMPEELPSFADAFPSSLEQTDRETVDKIGSIFES